jgi:hypothetical protein
VGGEGIGIKRGWRRGGRESRKEALKRAVYEALTRVRPETIKSPLVLCTWKEQVILNIGDRLQTA